MGTFLDTLKSGLVGAMDGDRKPGAGMGSLRAIANSEEVKEMLGKGVERLQPALTQLQKASTNKAQALIDQALESLQPVLVAGEDVYRSEAVRSLRSDLSRWRGGVLDAWEQISDSDEFKNLVRNVVGGTQPVFRSVRRVTASPEFQEFKKSPSSLAPALSDALKQAAESRPNEALSSLAARASKLLGGGRAKS